MLIYDNYAYHIQYKIFGSQLINFLLFIITFSDTKIKNIIRL